MWERTRKLVLSITLLVYFTLTLISLFVSEFTILNDYTEIQQYGMTFLDYIHMQFAPVDNPIGFFGAINAWIWIHLLGHFIAVCTSLFMIYLTICITISKRLISYLNYSVFFYTFFLISNLIIHALTQSEESAYTPILHCITVIPFLKIFNQTGTVVILLLVFAFIAYFTVRTFFITMISSLFVNNKKVTKEAVKPKLLEKQDFTLEKNVLPVKELATKIEQLTLQFPENDAEIKKEEIKIKRKPKQTTLLELEELEEYILPDIESFLPAPSISIKRNEAQMEEEIRLISEILKSKLAEFEVDAKVVNVNIGPIITQYELEPAPGIKVSRFSTLADDLALALKAKSIRVQAPIPGRGLIGIEIPNRQSEVILLRDVLLSNEMKNNRGELVVALGKDIVGQPIVADLTKMPHLLIAGATGSGKSVCINTIICSLLFRYNPDDIRLVLIDPKRIELSGYEEIPHLIQNVVTDPDEALSALNWAVSEMERRYALLQELKVRDIIGYNAKVKESIDSDEEFDTLPYIVIIVDEFADLIMTAGREIEAPICRLAQMARAIGIHIILATQRPSIKVITGIIKANFPARIAFRVSAKVDSRVILDSMGAERLLGRGDMLFLPPGKANTERIHGAFLADTEIETLVEYLKTQPKPRQDICMYRPSDEDVDTDFSYDDDLFPEAARVVVASNVASVSMLQRQFKIGYARAGRLVDLLERAGIIGPHVGSKSREVLITNEELQQFNFEKDNR